MFGVGMNKKLLTITIASVLGLVGCGSDSKNEVVKQAETNFAGTVNKGIVSNGKVEVCDTFDAQGCNAQAAYYFETTTDSSGKYSITGAPLNKPLMVAVSKKDTTTSMKCDIKTCTDANSVSVGFGDTFVVADGWQLKTILPAANSATSVVNVTSLTDIAAKQALDDAGNSPVTTQIANTAKYIVEKIFGLEGSITELGSVDLTDPAQTQGAAPEDINAALYSAAVMSSKIDTDVLIQNNGATYRIDPTLLNIIDSANDLVSGGTPLVKAPTASKKELDDHKVDLTTGADGFQKDENGNYKPIEVAPQPPAVNDIQAAKTFINDVRTTYMSVQDDGDLKKGLEDFGRELEVIAPLVEQDAEQALNNVQEAVEAIMVEFDKSTDDDNGFTVTVEGTTYTAVRTVSDSEATTVVANIKTVEVSDNETVLIPADSNSQADNTVESPDGGSTTAEIDLEVVSIRSSVGDVLLTGSGSAKVNGFVKGWNEQNENSESSWSWSEESDLTVNLVSLDISSVKMEFAGSESAQSASFEGGIFVSVSDFAMNESESSEVKYPAYDELNGSGAEANSGTLGYANFRFNGELTAGSDSADVYLNIIADNKRGYVYDESSRYSYACSWVSTVSLSNFDCSENNGKTHVPETSDKYVETYFTARVSTDVQNAINNNIAASVALEINRSQFDVANAKVTVGYNGVDTIIEAPVGLYDNVIDSDITVRNTTGAVATLTEFEDSIAGKVTVNGAKVASIEELDSGLVLVRYEDGSFESIF